MSRSMYLDVAINASVTGMGFCSSSQLLVNDDICKLSMFPAHMASISRHISLSGYIPLIHWGLNKMVAILQTTFSNYFSSVKIVVCGFKYFPWEAPTHQCSNWQQSSIRADDGFAPKRRQAIIWTKGGLLFGDAYMRCSASLNKHNNISLEWYLSTRSYTLWHGQWCIMHYSVIIYLYQTLHW